MSEDGHPSVMLGFIFALAMVAAATGLGALIDPWLPTANISVAYLVAVLVVAMRSGLRPSILASVLSFLAFNFFFTEPRWTLAITDTHNLLTVFFFLIAAVIVSNMASRLRSQIEETRESVRRTANLYDFASKVTAAVSRDDVLWAVVHHVAATIRGHSIVLLPNHTSLVIAASYPPEDQLDEKSFEAAQLCWQERKTAGRGTNLASGAFWLFLPMQTAHAPIGVMGVQMSQDPDQPSKSKMQLLAALADQGAVAIERTKLVGDIEAARISTERERLRAALMSSLSHDLRTPLSSIFGAASSLISDEAKLSPEDRRDLAQTVQDEAERLNRFVQNLLDMTKLGVGALQPRIDWADFRDIAGAAVKRTRCLSVAHPIEIDIDPSLSLLCVDAVLLEQAFFNLLDNAFKYAPENTPIKIWARQKSDHIAIEVVDQGPGIPWDDREKIFDMFFRVSQADSQAAGTGLGLAICRGIIEAHGGTIRAENGLNGAGTSIVILLPLPPISDQPAQYSEGEA
jgi:two-component system sensor histidine kinase KdpD